MNRMILCLSVLALCFTPALMLIDSSDASDTEFLTSDVHGISHRDGSSYYVALVDSTTTSCYEIIDWYVTTTNGFSYVVDGTSYTCYEPGLVVIEMVFDSGTVHTVSFAIEGVVHYFACNVYAKSVTPTPSEETVTEGTLSLSEHDKQMIIACAFTFIVTFAGFFVAYKYVRYKRSMQVVDV